MTKYADNYAGIRQAQAEERAHPSDLGTRHFTLDALNGSWVAQLQSRITQGLMKHGGLRLMQRIAPVVRLGPKGTPNTSGRCNAATISAWRVTK